MNVTRDVIRDLYPAYVDGEVSGDTRALVETWLASDPELAAELAQVPAPEETTSTDGDPPELRTILQSVRREADAAVAERAHHLADRLAIPRAILFGAGLAFLMVPFVSGVDGDPWRFFRMAPAWMWVVLIVGELVSVGGWLAIREWQRRRGVWAGRQEPTV